MNTPVELTELLARLQPCLNPGVYAWCLLPTDAELASLPVLALLRETEGTSLVLREEDALAAGLEVRFRAAWITLQVHSDLAAVGLTAAFARALADADISCNVLAGVHHDHIFVPVERAADAMAILLALQQAAARQRASQQV